MLVSMTSANQLLNPKPTFVVAAELRAGLQILLAVSETIREAGETPSGVIYAALAGRVSLEGYQSMLRTLKGAGLIEETPAHLLRWVGPLKGAK